MSCDRRQTRRGVATPTPCPSTSTNPPPLPKPKTRTIEVGGVTLNNRNPQTMCTLFTNADAGVAVKIRNLRVSVELRIEPDECTTNGDLKDIARCRNGMTLKPEGACCTGTTAKPQEPGEYAGWVRVDVSAACTSPGPKACSGPELADDPPSPTRPVIAVWTQRSEESVCFAIRAPDDANQLKFCGAQPEDE